MKLNNKIKKGLKQLEIPDQKAWLGAHADAFRLVGLLIKDEEEKIRKEFYSESDYDSPNWGLIKADQAGQLRVLLKLKSIINED